MHKIGVVFSSILLASTLAGCSVVNFAEDMTFGADEIAQNLLSEQPILKIANSNYINGNRYIKVVEVNGQKYDQKKGFMPLDFGVNYVKVECGRNNASLEEGQRLRYSEVHHLIADPGKTYNLEYFSRGFRFPEKNSRVRYCSEDCDTETGGDENTAVCNVFFTSEYGAIKTYVFGQKRIY